MKSTKSEKTIEETSRIPKVYTSRYKKSERVLRSCFVILFIILAIWVLKIIIFDSSSIVMNTYNPRLSAAEANFVRGTIYDRNLQPLAVTQQDEEGNLQRYYPYKEATAFITGYSDQSKSGLELEMNSDLLKTNSLVDSLRYWFLDQPVDGCDVISTIDGEMSQLAYELLGDLNGAIIVTNATAGEVYACVSKEAYDPNTVIENWDELMADEDNPFFNRATQGLYPPGSTFKIMTSLGWYRSEEYDPDYVYECVGTEDFDGYSLRCFAYEIHGQCNLTSAFAHSCNTFFATLGTTIGEETLLSTMKSTGFYDEIPWLFDTSTCTCSLKENDEIEELAIDSIGQGTVALTPLYLNRLTCAIANGGVAKDYLLVKNVVKKNGTVIRSYDGGETRLMNADEAEFLKELMHEVTISGTAADDLYSLPVLTYGKTGTAENESELDHSWFTGFIEAPNGDMITVTVLIEQSGGRLYGATLARQLFDYYLNHYSE